MGMMDVSRRRRRMGSAAAPDHAAEVQTLLSGTAGFALDPTDTSTMWQDTGTATPVTTASDPVGHIRSKWGTTTYDFIQGTGTERPIWDGTRFLTPDGVDDYLGADGTFAALKNAPGYYVAFRIGGTANNNMFFGISTATATTQRMQLQGATGRLRTQVRRLDADANTDNFGTVGALDGSTVAFEQDLSVNGNAVKYKDNVSVDTYTLAGSPANSSNTDSVRMRLFCALGNNLFQSALVGRLVLVPFVPSVAQRSSIQSWLTEV